MKIYCDCGGVISDSDPYDGRFITKEDHFELQRVLEAIIEDLKESIEQYPEENANRFFDRAKRRIRSYHRAYFRRFYQCTQCGRLYFEKTQWADNLEVFTTDEQKPIKDLLYSIWAHRNDKLIGHWREQGDYKEGKIVYANQEEVFSSWAELQHRFIDLYGTLRRDTIKLARLTKDVEESSELVFYWAEDEDIIYRRRV